MADLLADLAAQLEDDPKPTVKRAPKTTKRPQGRPSNRSIQQEIRDEIQAVIALLAMPWSLADPYCAGSLIDQSDAIAESLAEIAMKNPKLLEFMRKGGDVMVYFKLMAALSPVAKSVYEHHFKPLPEPEYVGS